MGENSKCAIQSVDRLFDIIEILANYPYGMTIVELSSESGLSPSTTHRFLSALLSRGYVYKDSESGKYRLTVRLFEIGSKVIPGLNILSVATPFLERLACESEETVHLVSRENDEVLYLFRQDAYSNSVNMGSRVGLKNPMYCTGVGKSILAYLPKEEVYRIWEKTEVVRYTEFTICDYTSLKKELESIREKGFSIDNQEHELGIRCLAVPLFDCDNKPFGAISVSGMANRMDDEKIHRLVPIVLGIGKEISKIYGAVD